MTSDKREVVITGNWKMNKTINEAVAYIRALAPLVKDSPAKILLAVPFTALAHAVEAAQDTNILIGAQNLCEAAEGAYTGEVSCKMLKDAGATFVIIGHSERRIFFNETNQLINKKIKQALQEDLSPILCIGETMTDRESNKTETVLNLQLTQGLEGIDDKISQVMLAYEPVWAIGSQNAATPEIAEQVHHFCRKIIAAAWSVDIAEHLIIQYGGAVKPDNAKSLLEQPDIDGLLVGSGSLTVESFSKIVNSSQNANIRI